MCVAQADIADDSGGYNAARERASLADLTPAKHRAAHLPNGVATGEAAPHDNHGHAGRGGEQDHARDVAVELIRRQAMREDVADEDPAQQADGLQRAGQQLTQRYANNDAQEHSNGEVALAEAHRRWRRTLLGQCGRRHFSACSDVLDFALNRHLVQRVQG